MWSLAIASGLVAEQVLKIAAETATGAFATDHDARSLAVVFVANNRTLFSLQICPQASRCQTTMTRTVLPYMFGCGIGGLSMYRDCHSMRRATIGSSRAAR